MMPTHSPRIYWLFGQRAAGRTELARALCEHLKNAGGSITLLDGDELRAGLCEDLGFTEADHLEKVRRGAHVARIHAAAGATVVCSFLTPKNSHCGLVRQILGEDVLLIHVQCALPGCRTCQADKPQHNAPASESLSAVLDDIEPPGGAYAKVPTHDRSLAASLVELCKVTSTASGESMNSADQWRERATAMGGVLSAREMEIMSLLSQGLRHKEMAEHLGISVTTVRTHLERACVKLSAGSRTEAVARFVGLSTQSPGGGSAH